MKKVAILGAGKHGQSIQAVLEKYRQVEIHTTTRITQGDNKRVVRGSEIVLLATSPEKAQRVVNEVGTDKLIVNLTTKKIKSSNVVHAACFPFNERISVLAYEVEKGADTDQFLELFGEPVTGKLLEVDDILSSYRLMTQMFGHSLLLYKTLGATKEIAAYFQMVTEIVQLQPDVEGIFAKARSKKGLTEGFLESTEDLENIIMKGSEMLKERSSEIQLRLPQEREMLYADLWEQLEGSTKIVEYPGPNNNRILVKEVCNSPFAGTHYDWAYVALFEFYERRGKITPGGVVFETTTGSAGRSAAALANKLGYECHVFIPAGGERARERGIQEKGGVVHLTSAEEFVNGFEKIIRKTREEHPEWFFLNHSMKGRGVNKVAMGGLEILGKEIVEQTPQLDYFISCIGNGSNTLGIGRMIKSANPNTKVIGTEPFSDPVAYEKIKQKRHRAVEFSRHNLPGMAYRGIEFPAIGATISEQILDDVILVADERTEREYYEKTKESLPEEVIRWDKVQQVSNYGRTTHAALGVALKIAEKVSNKTILTLAYDTIEYYDS